MVGMEYNDIEYKTNIYKPWDNNYNKELRVEIIQLHHNILVARYRKW